MQISKKKTLGTAEERLVECIDTFYKEVKLEFREREKFGELTDGMRQLLLKQRDIVPGFKLGSQFLIHFRSRKKMWVWEFVRMVHWLFSFYKDEERRLLLLLDIGTLLFYRTKDAEDIGCRPFHRPLREIFDEMVEKEVDKRVKKQLRLKEIEREVEGMEK